VIIFINVVYFVIQYKQRPWEEKKLYGSINGALIKPKKFGGKHCLEREHSGYGRHTDTQIFRKWMTVFVSSRQKFIG